MRRNVRYSFPIQQGKLQHNQWVLVHCPGWCESTYEIAQWNKDAGVFKGQIGGGGALTKAVVWFKKL